MTDPLVTLGVPVYGGQDALPDLLECLRTQSYKNIEVLISVDNRDRASAKACEPFLAQDTRFRMHVQQTRLGWAGNTDWTMRHRRGDFYIYQQHDDLLSATYVADLVEASDRWPNATICFSKVQFFGMQDQVSSRPSLLGTPKKRVLKYLRSLDWEPFRGLIRGSALDKTSALLLSDFDPFDSLGTEQRFMAELSLLGEFRFVEGPTYFKSWHGENLSLKRKEQSRDHRITAVACYAAWMIEVIAPAGSSSRERRHFFELTLERFAGSAEDPLGWIRRGLRRKSSLYAPLRLIWNQMQKSDTLAANVRKLTPTRAWMIDNISIEERAKLLEQIFTRLRNGNRFDPRECLHTTWEELEERMVIKLRLA
jgi:glycosyltransferase involved in cell wall biosynthesis